VLLLLIDVLQEKRSTVYYCKYGKEYLQAVSMQPGPLVDAKGRPLKYKVWGWTRSVSKSSTGILYKSPELIISDGAAPGIQDSLS
jgi:hypothetical protein